MGGGVNDAAQWSWALVLIEVSGIYLAVLDAGCYLLSWVHCNCATALDWGSIRTEAALQHDHDVMVTESGLWRGVDGAMQHSWGFGFG